MAQPQHHVRYNAMIVDNDVQSRMRLRQATTAVNEFGEVEQIGNLREAQGKLQGDRRCDVVFLSHHLDGDEVIEFIKQAKSTKQGQDSAYVLVLQNKDQEGSKVAASVMQGADGILFEPYSVDQLIELTRLAARVRKDRGDARERIAIKLMLTEIMNQLDLVAFLKSCDMEVTRSMKKLSDLCSVLHKMDEQKHAIYHEVAIEAFEAAPVPKRAFQTKTYKGASERIKRIMEKKLLAELEGAQEGAGETKETK